MRKGKTDTSVIASILRDNSEQRWFHHGKYHGWKVGNLPTCYLEWVIGNLSELVIRDVAEMELRRRGVVSDRELDITIDRWRDEANR